VFVECEGERVSEPTREDLRKLIETVIEKAEAKQAELRHLRNSFEEVEKAGKRLAELLKGDSAVPDDVLRKLVDLLENWNQVSK